MQFTKDIRRKYIDEKLDLLIKIAIYGACIFFFVVNTYAIFLNFSSNPTVLSTMVYKPESGIFNAPSIVICNETAFKDPTILSTDYPGFKNNTLRMDDFLVDVLVIRDAGKSILNAKPISIMDGVKEIYTAFHGTCYQSHENLQVNINMIRVKSILRFFFDNNDPIYNKDVLHNSI